MTNTAATGRGDRASRRIICPRLIGLRRATGLLGGLTLGLALGLAGAAIGTGRHPAWAAPTTAGEAAGSGVAYAGPVVDQEPAGLGVRFRRPAEWVESRPNGHTLVLSGPRESPQWVTTITLTNQQNPTPSLPNQGAARLLAEYLAAIADRGGAHETLREAPFHYTNPGPGVDGVQAVVRFLAPTGPVRQWVVVLARVDIPVAHVLIYAAPDDLFDQGLPVARLVADSLTILPSAARR